MSLLWKLFCLRRLIGSPLFGQLSADSEAYWVWAQIVVRDGWVGHNAFFLGPLYPYLLSLLRPTADSSYVAPLVLQCVLGAATSVLIACACRVVCAPRFAIVSGLIAAGYSMATFMDLSILAESLLWCLGATLLFLQLRALAHRPTRWLPAVSGLLIGLMSLARPSFMFLLAPIAMSAVSVRGVRSGLRSTAIALACATAVCLPVLVRHIVLGHGWILNTYSLGFNAYVGNGPQATGTYSIIGDAARDDITAADMEGGADGDGRDYIARQQGSLVSPLASSSYWLERTWTQVASHPVRALRLLATKGLLSLNHLEASQLDSLGLHERLEGPFGLPWVGSFGVVGVMGLFGLFLMRRTAPGHVLLAQAIAVWAPLVIFFVTDRYRHHLALPLLVAQGPAIEAGWAGLRAARTALPWRATSLVALIAAAGLVWLPLIRFNRLQIEFALHQELGQALLRKGDLVGAEAELKQCVEPSMLSRLPLRESAAARSAVANVMSSLGDAFVQRGLYARGKETLELASRLSPGDRELRRDYAVLLAMNGSRSEACAELDTLGAPITLLVSDLLRIAERAVSQSAWDPAERALRAALEVDSTSEPANVILVRLLHARGREQEARALLERMRGRGVALGVIERESAALLGHP